MDGVQEPIVAVIGDLIRQHPGTISLGQGIVSYGPPPEAVDALRAFPRTPDDHRYGPVEGTPALVRALCALLPAGLHALVRVARLAALPGGRLGLLGV